jgi:hypothetical protein
MTPNAEHSSQFPDAKPAGRRRDWKTWKVLGKIEKRVEGRDHVWSTVLLDFSSGNQSGSLHDKTLYKNFLPFDRFSLTNLDHFRSTRIT